MAWPADDPSPFQSWDEYWQHLAIVVELSALAAYYLRYQWFNAAGVILQNVVMEQTRCHSWLARQLSEPSVMSDDAILGAVFRAMELKRGPVV